MWTEVGLNFDYAAEFALHGHINVWIDKLDRSPTDLLEFFSYLPTPTLSFVFLHTCRIFKAIRVIMMELSPLLIGKFDDPRNVNFQKSVLPFILEINRERVQPPFRRNLQVDRYVRKNSQLRNHIGIKLPMRFDPGHFDQFRYVFLDLQVLIVQLRDYLSRVLIQLIQLFTCNVTIHRHEERETLIQSVLPHGRRRQFIAHFFLESLDQFKQSSAVDRFLLLQ